DQMVGQHPPHVQHGHQRLAAGEHARVRQRLQQPDDLGDGLGIVIVKARRLHRRSALMISTRRGGVTGSRVTAPGTPSASSIAEAMTAPTGLTPLSPAPFTPSGLSGLGASSVSSTAMPGASHAVGIV